MDENTLENAAAIWRASAAATDFIRAVERIPVGADRARVRELLGSPVLVSPAADGSESWLYVPSDPARGQFEALFVAFDPNGRFLRLDRKPID
jgi:outer membrane protein assembly factor BamE (lipoprotein component of BamABCDE complex)